MAKPINIVGQKFGKLTVLKYVGKSKWLCKCDCGKETIVGTYHLKSGNTKSCGCLNIQKIIERNTKHNLGHTRIYQTWKSIKRRCYGKNTVAYKNYGARGITVCQEWLSDFNNFYNWAISNGYQDDLSIDRIDVNKGYSPDNCHWATDIEQANNTRRNHLITYNDKTQTLAQWAREYNIAYNNLQNRIVKLNWSIEKALTAPIQKHS